MARYRHRYEDVMDVALRATLKENGFKRKSRTTFICERSTGRLWTFRVHPCSRHADHFTDFSAICVDAIEDILARHVPEAAFPGRYEKPYIHAYTDIVDLIKVDKGWDSKSWNRNPRSRNWLGGYRRPPSVDTIVRHLQPGGCFSFDAAGDSIKLGSEEWHRRIGVITEELGHDLDMLWRKYALDWLQRCDDPLYFAEWMEHYQDGNNNLLRAAAYHLAGADDRAAEFLRRDAEEAEVPFEVMVEILDVEERGDPKWRWLHGDQRKSREWVENLTRSRMAYLKQNADNAKRLAKGLSIVL